jgi:hypothetical protein
MESPQAVGSPVSGSTCVWSHCKVVSGVEQARAASTPVPLPLDELLAVPPPTVQIMGPWPSGFGLQVAPPEHSELDAQNW